MSFSVRLWDQSSAYVSIEPQWATQEGIDKIWNLNRTATGNATLYTYATWREWRIPVKLIPSSAAAWVNSLFLGSCLAQLEVIEDGVSAVYSVMLTNKVSPFSKYSEPHIDRMDGELRLSEY